MKYIINIKHVGRMYIKKKVNGSELHKVVHCGRMEESTKKQITVYRVSKLKGNVVNKPSITVVLCFIVTKCVTVFHSKL